MTTKERYINHLQADAKDWTKESYLAELKVIEQLPDFREALYSYANELKEKYEKT